MKRRIPPPFLLGTPTNSPPEGFTEKEMIIYLFCWILLFSYYDNAIIPNYSSILRSVPFALFALLSCVYFLRQKKSSLYATKHEIGPILILVVAILAASTSQILQIATVGFSLEVFAVFCVTSVAWLALAPWPTQNLIKALLNCVLIAATLDAISNILAALNIIELSVYGGRHAEDGAVITRYPGLSGNTHLAGLVNFLGCAYLLSLLRGRSSRGKLLRKLFLAALLFTLLISLTLIDARRYTIAVGFVAAFLFLPTFSRFPLYITGGLMATVALSWMFLVEASSLASNSDLRVRLFLDGVQEARDHWLLGTGAQFMNLNSVEATYESLSAAGVTESMFLQYTIWYGILSSTCLVVSAFWVATVSQRRSPLEAVILTALTAELFYGGVLLSMLGSLVYFGCFWICLRNACSTQVSLARYVAPPQVGKARVHYPIQRS
jgi:hypothetical protein